MASPPRYAIYFVPAPDSDIYRFGAQALGYDAFAANPLPFPDALMRSMPDWQELTQEPRKYGFHGTLKAPLVLAPGNNEAALLAACESFAQRRRPVPMIEPVVNAIEGFIALVPGAPSTALNELAQDCVETFDAFRAPLTEEDRARRIPTRLTPRQITHLDRWGYPYVMADFRFHMTLTGRIPAERRDAVLTLLREQFAELGRSAIATLAIDRIAVFRQDDAQSRFRIIAHHALQPLSAAASA
jgi:putative phosphonate metabolism protein